MRRAHCAGSIAGNDERTVIGDLEVWEMAGNLGGWCGRGCLWFGFFCFRLSLKPDFW